jgi:large subunit ribosomal protein L25
MKMDEIILKAIKRADGKFKESGFIPGVLYGDGVDAATAVKFEEKALNKVITNYGKSAKLWININENKQYGFIKEVQRKHLTRNITHVDVQIVSKDHEIKMKIPIIFQDEDILKSKQLQLQVYKSEITVFGKMALMPDVIEVNVSDMKLGDTMTLSNFNLDKQLKIDNEDAICVTVINLREQPAEVVATETK